MRVELHLEPGTLGAAHLYLGNVLAELEAFAAEYQHQIDAEITNAIAHARNAYNLLDSDHYTDR